MFFEKNAAALSKTPANEFVLQVLRQVAPADDLEIFKTGDGSLTLKYKSVFLHDIDGALAEARQLCDQYCHPSLRACHIIFGLGLGYLLREVRNRSKGKVFIYEPNLPLLRYVLDNVDLSAYFEVQNTFLAIDRKVFTFQLQRIYTFGERLDILIPKGYVMLMGEEINDMLKYEINKIVRNEKNGSSISVLFQDEWVKHFISNIPFLPKAHVLPALSNRYVNKPALVVSAGPSLEDAIPVIKRIADRVVIIAIGRTLSLLQQHGIQPDFVTFLDYEGPYEQLDQLPMSTENVSFILAPFANQKAYNTPAKHYFTVLTDNYSEFSHWYDTTFQTNTSRIITGSSVSLLSLHCSFLMGCNPIILVGQDLAFRDKQLYAGSDQQANITEDGFLLRKDVASLKDFRFEVNQVKGQDGRMLNTSPDYVWFIDQFNDTGKNMKAYRPELRLINASVGGADIEQFENCSLTQMEAEGNHFVPFDKTPVLRSEQELTVGEIGRKTLLLKTALELILVKIEDIVKYARFGHEQAALMLQSDCDQWANQNQQLWYYRKELSKRLNSDQLIAYFFLSDVLALYRSYQVEVDGLHDIIKNIKLDMNYFETIEKRAEEKFKPWILDVLETVRAMLPDPAEV